MNKIFTISGFSDEISPIIEEQFKTLNRLGIEYFEPRGVDGENISAINDDKIKDVKAKMKKYGIRVSSIGSPIGKISIYDDFEPHFKMFKRTVEIAKALETKYIRIFSFFIPQGEEPKKYRSEVMRRLKMFADYAEEQNVIILHENEKGIYGAKGENCLDIMETLSGEHFRVVFDPANFVQCGEDTKKCYEMLEPYIEYMHIKDAIGERVVPSGCGQGNVEFILKSLKDKGFKGFLSIEPHLGSFEGLSDLELDDKMEKLPRGGEGTFTLAYNSLCEILERICG